MAKSKNKYQEMILEILGTRPIAFNPDLARALGSVPAGVSFSQLLYWEKKGRNKEMFYKTVKEMQEETALTKDQQLTAQKICVEKGILSVFYKGIPCKRHFKIEIDKTIELFKNYFGEEKIQKIKEEKLYKTRTIRLENRQLVGDPLAELLGNFPTPITETTPEITPREFPTYSRSKRQKAFAVPVQKNNKLEKKEPEVNFRDYKPEFLKTKKEKVAGSLIEKVV